MLIVISQVYGGGGNSGATYTNDFIELFNRGEAAVDLAGWSVQYAYAAGTNWQVTTLAGSLAPGRRYLIRQAAGAGGTQSLPAPDAAGDIAMAATAGKVALVRHAAALVGSCPAGDDIVDMVGYGGSAACFEGTGRAPAPGNTTAVLRKAGGCADTGDNAADFQTGPPDPRNSTSPADVCGASPPAATQADGFAPVEVRPFGGAALSRSAFELFEGARPRAPFVQVSFSAPRPSEGSTRWRRGASASGPRGMPAARPPPRGASP